MIMFTEYVILSGDISDLTRKRHGQKTNQGRDLSVDFALVGRVGKPAWVCREFCV